ncbi:MAG: CidA/LrgA family protein [Candidatus Competibacteraceae bacterium]|nr:MAG: CidA/LrgA family protein [Candidatus Competibacteraceae bacterium]
MIGALAVLLAFQLTGEIAIRWSGVPVPGPVVGMLLLFLALRWRKALPDPLRATAETLLSHLSLLFIPAGVGIVQHGARLAEEWLAITVALVLSTLITVAVTALVMQTVIRWRRGAPHDG